MKNFYKKIFAEINDILNKTDYNSIEKITKLLLSTNKKNKKSFVQKYDKKREDKKLNGTDIGFFIVEKKFLNFFKEKSKNYSFESDFLIKAIEFKKLIAYRTDRQYYSITNFKMLKKFEKISKKKKLGYI